MRMEMTHPEVPAGRESALRWPRRQWIRTVSTGLLGTCLGGRARGASQERAEIWKQQARRRHRIIGVRTWRVNLNPVTMADMGFSRSPVDPRGKRLKIPPGPRGTHVDWRGPFAAQAGALMVEVTTDGGLKGYGLGGGGAAGALVLERHLQYFVLDEDPLDVESLWDHLYHVSSIYGRRGLVIYALSGLDLALWDLCGRILETPVFALVSENPRRRIPAYATGTDPSYYVSRGFRACKIPLSRGLPEGARGFEENLETVRKAREAVGQEVELMVDAYLRWDVEYTLRFAQAAADLGLKWIEEPIALDDDEGMARLVREVDPTWIVSGEHEFTRYGFRELLRWKAADMIQPDVSWAGGFGECLRIAREAAAQEIPTWPHQGATPWGLHLIAALPLPCRAETFGPSRRESDNQLSQALRPQPDESGTFTLEERPGFGLELDEQLIQAYAL